MVVGVVNQRVINNSEDEGFNYNTVSLPSKPFGYYIEYY